MIKLYDIKNEFYTKEKQDQIPIEIPFEITIFPDKTSQVWRVKDDNNSGLYRIVWNFENEAELIHVLQLATLISKKGHVYLHIPYLVYGRQDKPISNNSTFALIVFGDVLLNSGLFKEISSLDIHNPKAVPFIRNIIPNERIKEVLKDSDATAVCFPDKGASMRGYKYDREYYGEPIILDKKRNQQTGEIEGLKFASKVPYNLSGFKVLILDDIGDGMRTFIEASKLLKAFGAKEVYVYTTHGIYSKGLDVVFDSGIDRVFNYNEEVFDGRKK